MQQPSKKRPSKKKPSAPQAAPHDTAANFGVASCCASSYESQSLILHLRVHPKQRTTATSSTRAEDRRKLALMQLALALSYDDADDARARAAAPRLRRCAAALAPNLGPRGVARESRVDHA